MDVESELLKTISAEQLEIQIAEKISSFHGLLTRDVALRLIAKEKGLLKSEERVCRLAEIRKGERKVGFAARVRRIWPIAEYSSGKRSRVVEVEDEGASMPLILWNQDVGLARALRSRDEIVVRGAYEKGGELHLGYSGTLEVSSKAPFSDLGELKDNEHVHLRGFVSAIEGEDRFVRGMETVRGFSFIISDGKSERRCVMFGGLGRASRLEDGDEIIIEGALVHYGNIEIGPHSRILSRRAKDMLIGELAKLEAKGPELVLEAGGKSVVLDRIRALRFLGVQAADDIELSTVVALKKESLLNTKIALRI